MIPISDDNPTIRTPVVTILLLAALGVVWVFGQGAGFNDMQMAASVCNWGLVPAELTGGSPVGTAVPIGEGVACVVDNEPINIYTPITSMFLHGGWMHLLGNGLFLWIFGNNVEDSMGRGRFVLFYLICGLAAAAIQVAVAPASPVPMVGASGAISGVLGAYLLLYPKARVNVLFIIIIFVWVVSIPAYLVLLWWIGIQVLSGLPQLGRMAESSGGVAFWAHIGGFAAGLVLVKLFVNPALLEQRRLLERRRQMRFHWP
jgi:membrane associated rhomboid family serine protease